MKRRNSMFTTLEKKSKKSNSLPYVPKHQNEEVQIIISHQIVSKLGQDMKEMSSMLSRSILEGMNIEYRK